MGFLQQVKLWFSGKFVKQSNANNFKNKSLNVHTVNKGETWPVNIILQAPLFTSPTSI